MKQIKKIIYLIVVLVISGLAISGLALLIYKDLIIDMVKSEVNHRIKTELSVEAIDVSLLKGFPNISVEFNGVKFHSAFEDELLLASQHIYIVINVIDLLYNEITIERLEIENANLIIHKDASGSNNFDVFELQDSLITSEGGLDIKSIKLLNVEILHIDEVRNIYDEYNVRDLTGSVVINNSTYQFNVRTNTILTDTRKPYLGWLLGKHIYLNTISTYNADEILIFKPSDIKIDNSSFKFGGFLELGSDRKVSINLEGESLNFADLSSLAPKKTRRRYELFKSKGLIVFNASLKGSFANKNWPGFIANFILKDFEISHSKIEYPIKEIYLEGGIDIQDLRKLETAQLEITKFKADVNNRIINIRASINNFDKPKIVAEAKGDIDVAWLMSIAFEDDQTLFGQSTGLLSVDLTTSFSLENKLKPVGFEEPKFNGKIKLEQVGATNFFNLPLKEVDGTASFINNKIEFLDLAGIYGNSDFNINGFVLIPAANQPGLNRKIEAKVDISSHRVELDEIVKNIISFPTDSSVNIDNKSLFFIDIELKVEELNFGRFHGKNFKTKALVDQKGLKIKKAISNSLGGEIALTGSITKQFNGDIYIEAKTKTQSVDLDSLFYVFSNFNQDFITASVIKGELDSEIYTHMYFNKDWRLHRNLLYAEGVFQVKEGELNNFEPIMSLSDYLKNEEENLAKLRFSDLESSIIIANDTVFISDMYIGSNVRNIKVGGYHTLDQAIDYRLSVPVSGKNRDRDEAFGEIKKDKNGKMFIPFRIKGSTTDYKVNYDLKRAGSNLVKGFKNELSGNGNPLAGKSKIENKGDTLVLDDDEFFDWDNK